MEVRGEVRGEGCCFMHAMRAIYKTIRDRLRPRRSRQRTKNYRICRNSAMTKKEKNPRNHLTSGLNSWVYKNSLVDTTQRRSQKEGGAHEELQARLRSSLRASQERRKPRWVIKSGLIQNSLAVNMDETQAKHLQPVEPKYEISNMEEDQAKGDCQVDESINEIMEEAQSGEDFQSAEPAIWIVAHAQMWQEMTEPDPVSWCKMPFMYCGPGSKFAVPSAGALDRQWRSSESKEGGQQEPSSEATNLEDTKAGEDFQPGEVDIQLDEQTSWVVAHAHMWQKMTEPDPVSWCNMPIMYSGPGSKYPVPPEWDLDHLIEVWRSTENKEEGKQGVFAL